MTVSGETIDSASLNDNDVLFGRGRAACRFIGNKRFRELVETRKKEYMSLGSYKVKGSIAKEVYSEITSRGGRFLALNSKTQLGRNILRDGVWKETSKKIALEKCKQSLRQLRSGKQDALTNVRKPRGDVSALSETNEEAHQEYEEEVGDQEENMDMSDGRLSPVLIGGLIPNFLDGFDGSLPVDLESFDWGEQDQDELDPSCLLSERCLSPSVCKDDAKRLSLGGFSGGTKT